MEIVAACLFGLDIAILISFQVLHRDYRVFSRAVSQYGVGKTAHLFKLYVISGCIAAPLLAWQYWQAGLPGYSQSVPFYLCLVALGRLGVGLFPVDMPGAPRTRAGMVHHAATLMAFGCAFIAITEATPMLVASTSGPGALILSSLKHVVNIGFLAVGLSLSLPLPKLFGLAERAFLYSAALWFLTATLVLPPL